MRKLILVLMVFCNATFAQDTLKVMSYNILNYSGDATREGHFRTTIQAANPDVLVVQEIMSQSAVNNFFSAVVNVVFPGEFVAGTFIDGPDTDNAIYVRTAKISFVSNRAIRTALRDINEFMLYHPASAESLRVYSVHLKASAGSDNEAKRAAEVDSLRKVTNALPIGKYSIVVGDFNIYSSNESAYRKLLDSTSGIDGQFVDPLNLPGLWNNSSYAIHHTQSPRTRAFGGGATGGMDDRFDMILYSRALRNPGSVTYLAGSTIAFGNDGLHYNDSINRMPNNAVSVAVANALHYGSDHLPVIAKFVFHNNILPIQLSYFTGNLTVALDSVLLRWGTVSETGNYGFEVQKRKAGATTFLTIPNSFVPGNGTTIVPQSYSFTDPITQSGTWLYRLKQIDSSGPIHYTEPIQIDILTGVRDMNPNSFTLEQNFPNPFNPETNIRFSVIESGRTILEVYNLLGENLGSIFDGFAEAGHTYSVTFDGSDLSSGVYLYKLSGNNGVQVKRMILLR